MTISNWNGSKWEKITFEQFLMSAANEKTGIAMELTKETWKENKPLLVKHGFAQADGFIDWRGKGSSLIHFAAPH